MTPFFVRRARPRAGYSLAEVLVSMAVFSLATLGIWECIRTTFFLSAKNTGLNLSHTALQQPTDMLANQLRSCLQVIDVASFDGANFTHIDEASATGATAAGNAVRFLRILPVSLFMLPDDGTTYTMTSAQDPFGISYPDYLTAGNKKVKVAFSSQTANLASAEFKKDLVNARLLPRFPYLTETVSSGANPGTKPGLDLSATPALTSSPENLSLAVGLPTATKVPSCNQAYLVIESAAVVVNRTYYSELIYYPDANDLTRKNSLTMALATSSSGPGPTAFALMKSAGPLADPSARGSLCITLPVYAGGVGNAAIRQGGKAAMTNVTITLPVELRRRAQF